VAAALLLSVEVLLCCQIIYCCHLNFRFAFKPGSKRSLSMKAYGKRKGGLPERGLFSCFATGLEPPIILSCISSSTCIVIFYGAVLFYTKTSFLVTSLERSIGPIVVCDFCFRQVPLVLDLNRGSEERNTANPGRQL
jgi:hypothetical protein